jgi:hypothetical protein
LPFRRTLKQQRLLEKEYGLKHGFRLLSSYPLPRTGATVWIITERDRSVTTILLPEEY